MLNKAVIYTRVSSDEQKKSGYSLDYQEKRGREYAQKNNLEIVQIFSESHTAKKPGRPKFNEMLSFVKKHKIGHLIFCVHHRAARNGIDAAQLVYMAEYLGFNIHLIEDNLVLCKNSRPTDYMIFEVSNCMANFYPRNLSIDVSTKMREKAEQGYYPNAGPVGYMSDTTERRKRKHLQIDPVKAPYIKKIFELYSTGKYSFSSLAQVMREDGFKVSKTGKCYKTNIEDILNNPIYMGDFIWNGKRYYNAKHEPIVSRELFDACQRVIKTRQNTSMTKHDFIFSNTLRCSKCGCFLVGELKKKKYIYYHCTGNRGGNCKKSSYIREEIIEKKFLETLETFRLTPDLLKFAKKSLRNELENQNLYNEKRIKTLEKEIEQQKNRLNKLFDLYIDGEITKELYKKKQIELEEQLEEMSLAHSSYLRTGVEILKYSELMFELCQNASALYLHGNIDEKREIVKIVCSNFSYDGENVTITIKKAFQPLVEIASLKMVDSKQRNSNFISYIRDFISELSSAENVVFFEKILCSKICA